MDGQNGGNEPMNPFGNGAGNASVGGVQPETPNPTNDGADSNNVPTIEGTNNVPSDVSAPGDTALPSSDGVAFPDNAGSMEGGAIYSDPDLTISKDAIVAPGVAMGSAITQSTATGDIKLTPTRRLGGRGIKVPLIIGGIIIAIMIIVVVVLLLMRAGGSGNITQDFNEYYDYSQKLFTPREEDDREETEIAEDAIAEDIDDEADGDDDLAEDGVDDEEEGEAETEDPELSPETIVELRAKFDKFKQSADASRSNKIENLRGKIDTLDKYLGLAERAVAVEKVERGVLETYINHGEDATRELLSNMQLADQEDRLYAFANTQVNYYGDMVGMYIESERIGCAKEGEIDTGCVARYYGDGGFKYNDEDSRLARIRNGITHPDTVGTIGREILTLNQEIKTELEK